MKDKIEIKLDTTITAGSTGGEFLEYDTIVIMPPRARDDSLAFDLSSEFSCASFKAMALIKSLSKQENSEDDAEEKTQQVQASGVSVMEILKAGKADYGLILKRMKALLIAGTMEKPQSYLTNSSGDKAVLTEPLFTEISIKDKRLIVGEYIANFT